MSQCNFDSNNGKKTEVKEAKNGKPEQPNPKRFKTAALAVIKKIKLLRKGVSLDENLPNPADLPITTSCHLSIIPLMVPDSTHIKIGFQEKFQDDIDLNSSLSKTGACVLYRDRKTKNCIVKDIPDRSLSRSFFEWYSCYNLMPESAKVVILDINMNIVHAFNALLENHTRAAPIWDSRRQRFVAMFTITDFIKLLHKYYVVDKLVLENIPNNTIKDWRDMMETDSDPQLIHVRPETNLRQAASVIGKHNIHRLPVLDPCNGNVLAIVTNSQLFRFFYEKFLSKGVNQELLTRILKVPKPNYYKTKICELKIGNYNEAISTIHPWQTVYSAFDIFVKNHISVLPVVDEENRLVDIYARYDVIASIGETDKYLNLDCTISKALKFRNLVRPPCTCSKENTFTEVLQMIHEAQVHRIFVVDSDMHILGVISLSDILSFLCNN